MPLDCIDELENKIDNLLNSLKQTRKENEEIKGRVRVLEQENGDLKAELDTCKTGSAENHVQLDSAVEKIKNLITRLEAVE